MESKERKLIIKEDGFNFKIEFGATNVMNAKEFVEQFQHIEDQQKKILDEKENMKQRILDVDKDYLRLEDDKQKFKKYYSKAVKYVKSKARAIIKDIEASEEYKGWVGDTEVTTRSKRRYHIATNEKLKDILPYKLLIEVLDELGYNEV